jgi:nucleoside triphosphate pyrophosphatase
MLSQTLLLASNSPRRKQLLALGGWTFTTAPADIDESTLPGESPRDYVMRLAEAKARTSARQAQPGQVVVGSDTSVIIDGDILGKPADSAEAESMLRRLRGRTHQVFTGIAVFRPADGKLAVDLCITDVPMRAYSDEEIRAYVATGDPLDKAGAYAIQHPGFQPVASMSGCFSSVMGLPHCHLARLLREFGLRPTADLPGNCQVFLKYKCPVFPSILGTG